MSDQTPALDADPYGQHYFENYWGGGGPYERNQHWLSFFSKVADGIIRDLHPTSVLDAGCAMGFLVETLNQRGVPADGIDISEYAISQVDESVRERCRVATLTDPIETRYDLITCIEVIEHLPAEQTEAALANLCSATDRLLLSSTPQDFGEPTHWNVRPSEEWAALLAKQGFVKDLDQDFSYISPSAHLYRRSDASVPEIVREYDRVLSRKRQEAIEVRQALGQSQARLADLETTYHGQPGSDPLKQRDEEILRLRDLLIGMESELGSARGRLAELQDHSTRLTNTAHRIQRIVPAPIWSLLLRLRNLIG